MLETCTSSQAAALRDSIYDLAEQGMPSDEIVEWMIGNHGEEWRAVPMRSGAGLWAWIVPPLVLLAGLVVIVGWWKSRRSDPVERVTEGSSITDAEREQVAHAMRKWQDAGEEEI
jgi:cytochrome c-type biogenesis protein CcmH/NrfF